MKSIPLVTGSHIALVDDEDFDRLIRERWYPFPRPRTVYARNRKGQLMHRILLGNPVGHVDHKDANGLNNQRDNLRVCTQASNNANVRRRERNSSGFKGVHWYPPKQCWRAQCQHRHVGYYATKEEAAKAYDAAAQRAFGEFANLNFPVTAA